MRGSASLSDSLRKTKRIAWIHLGLDRLQPSYRTPVVNLMRLRRAQLRATTAVDVNANANHNK